MRYAYAITGALLLGGTAIAVTTSSNVGAQTAQNEGLQAAAPAGAPASLADMVELVTTRRVQESRGLLDRLFGRGEDD